METKELGNGFYCDSLEEGKKEIDVFVNSKLVLFKSGLAYALHHLQ